LWRAQPSVRQRTRRHHSLYGEAAVAAVMVFCSFLPMRLSADLAFGAQKFWGNALATYLRQPPNRLVEFASALLGEIPKPF